ncbi:hypothetical protein GCM10011581_35950 [Saccharopolyspora subtropica]|uniref:Uncharacterized protein n=1 Tax=Saccharopolyspora thermophila TaxID=89367 RepID=A0A917NEX3_9PSEU|nr:hypothetical protein [Saccharopolyspora subtropica]GGI95615.1 hypothetical protein GCM10011581_35950 [Saccharopolyspora subtropica]
MSESNIWAPEPDEYALLRDEIDRAPRLFALCELDRDETDWEVTEGRVFAWGLAFPDRAQLVSTDGRDRGTFQSADRAAEIFARTAEVRLVYPSERP